VLVKAGLRHCSTGGEGLGLVLLMCAVQSRGWLAVSDPASLLHGYSLHCDEQGAVAMWCWVLPPLRKPPPWPSSGQDPRG